MKIIKQTIAGSVESGDILVTIEPSSSLEINLQSKFIKQYGKEINKLSTDILKEFSIKEAKVTLNDQGALPSVIRARILAAIERQGK